jgi:apolipoprotein N-acyltransferase
MNISITDVVRSHGAAMLSGVLLVLAFPRIEWYLLAWVALVPLLSLLYDRGPFSAFKAGILCGFVYFFGTTYWIYHSIHAYGSAPLVVSLLVVGILALYLSLYTGLFSLLCGVTLRKTDLPAVLIAPVFWVALEFVRSYAMTGFPWSSLGYSQYRFLPLIQVADITGIYGISFLIVAVNGALADLFLVRRRKTARPLASLLPTILGFTGLAVILAFSLGYGLHRLDQVRPGASITVGVIQGNIEQDKKWDPLYQSQVLSVYKDLSLSQLSHQPQLLIWPETSVPFIFGGDRALTDAMVVFQRTLGTYLLFGSILTRQHEAPSRTGWTGNGKSAAPSGPMVTTVHTNSAVLLDRDGKISYTYDKIHLVPFGEYVPLRSFLFFVDKLAFGVGDYAPGTRYTKAVTPFGSFCTVICYEIIFPGLVRKFYTQGGDFIVTITNDAWFGETSGPYQHFSMAVFRAVENRKPVIRAANSGISGFIDSNGWIASATELFKRTGVVGQVKTDRTLTAYTKYGDIFSYLCIVTSVVLLLIANPMKP